MIDYAKSKPLKAYTSMTEEEYFNRITESRKAIEEGKLITQEEAKEYFKKYLLDEEIHHGYKFVKRNFKEGIGPSTMYL